MDQYTESLTKATHDINFTLESLQSALHVSNSVEGIVLLQLIEKTAILKKDIVQLQSASVLDRA